MPGTVPQREYETIYILRASATREITEDVAHRVSDAIGQGGSLTGIENWGRRRLAHDIGREKRGIYVYFKYVGGGSLVSEVERTLRLHESVMKFQTVKLGPAAEAVDAGAELKFEHIDHTEEDEDETLAQMLGLEAPRYARPVETREDVDEADSDDDDGSNDDE